MAAQKGNGWGAKNISRLVQSGQGADFAPELAMDRPTAWTVGLLALLGLSVPLLLALGIAVIVWAPMVIALGVGMLAVWAGRRRRQHLQGRNGDEVKDPLHAEHPWPREGIIDDRLPEPHTSEPHPTPPS
jgi:hypothetical protein